MNRARVVLIFFSTILSFLWLMPEGMLAQDVNRAALIIRLGDQNVQSACVEFSEPEISGLEILQRSGLDIEIDVQSMGAKVCSIEQTGCPPDDCWCQCKGGGDCVYWSYWHQLNGQWEYAQGGATVYSVGDGDVEGWSWGPGSVNEAYPPPVISFSDVCETSAVLEDTATPTPTSEPILFVPGNEPTSVATQVQAAANTATPTPLPTATNAATATAVPTLTSLPVNTATAVPETAAMQNAPANQPPPVVEAPTTAENAVADTVQVIEPTVVSDSPPTQTPLPPAAEVVQPSPEPVAVAAVPEVVLPTRPLQREIKNPVATADTAERAHIVIGSAVELADLGPPQIDYETHLAAVESERGTTSRLSYAIFCLIVLALTGMLLLSSLKRRTGQN